MIPIHILYAHRLCSFFSSSQTLSANMLPSQTGQIWPSTGELDSCHGSRPMQGPNIAELVGKSQNCYPELAVPGPMKPVSSPYWLHELRWRARCKAYAKLAYDP